MRAQGVMNDALATRRCAHRASFMTSWPPVDARTGRHEWHPGHPSMRAQGVIHDILTTRRCAHRASWM